MKLYLPVFILATVLLASCSSSKKLNTDYIMFQKNMDSLPNAVFNPRLINSGDVLLVRFYSESLNQEQVIPFNGGLESKEAVTGRAIKIDENGFITIPVVGKMKAAGFSIAQLKALMKEKVQPYIKSPGIDISFSNFKIYVLGEVVKQRVLDVTADKVTILDAISEAEGLTENARRDNIKVIRNENNSRKVYTVDFRSGTLFNQPAFYLQDQDVVYVSPTDLKLRRKAGEFSTDKLQKAVAISSLVFLLVTLFNIFKK